MKHKFYITAELMSVEETSALRKEAASVIDLPKSEERQPDLAYFTSRFVSTGTNLNNAHFLPSELVKASATVPGKAVDIEHEEDKIIGHIYKHAFTDVDGNHMEYSSLSKQKSKELDTTPLHIEIASVVYKTRFPEIVEEIQNGDWKVSMEAYYMSYDLLVGSTILSIDEAKLMGIDVAHVDDVIGRQAKIVKAGKVIDEGKVARVLRDICFSGVGIVKQPANPPSIIFEAVASTENSSEEIIILEKKEKDNNVTYSSIVDVNTTGICVSYYKELLDSVVKTQDTKVLQTNWCSKYETNCPVYGEATDPKCLRFVNGDAVMSDDLPYDTVIALGSLVEEAFDKYSKEKKTKELLDKLLKLL